MATKEVTIDGIGAVSLYKRKGSRHIRLSVTSTGKIRATMPTWVPYSAGIAFVKQKQDWLKGQIRPKQVLRHGAAIGKSHRLLFGTDADRKTVTTRIMRDGAVVIKMPAGANYDDNNIQQAAIKASVRALKREAEDVLPGRLRELANEHGFNYRSVEVKQLKSRWGSCNHRQEITLNCFLMQLPWELVDYVLVHELVHTKIMAHGPRFWGEMSKHIADLPRIRKAMRQHQPTVKEVLQNS